MQITISKTVQVRQFEPLTVTVTDEGSDEQELYERVALTCKRVLVKEYNRYSKLADQGVEDNGAKPTTQTSIPKLKKKREAKIVR